MLDSGGKHLPEQAGDLIRPGVGGEVVVVVGNPDQVIPDTAPDDEEVEACPREDIPERLDFFR